MESNSRSRKGQITKQSHFVQRSKVVPPGNVA